MSECLKTQKKNLRKILKKTLQQLSKQSIHEQSKSVSKKVLESDWYQNCNRLSIYVHTEGEIETNLIILHALKALKTVFIPHFVKGQKNMQMIQLHNLEDLKQLKPNLWGIRQFSNTSYCALHKSEGPFDLVFIPGCAFTQDGLRLGHGMGYYDKFLSKHKQLYGRLPHTVALALREQIVDVVPTEEHDVRIDFVLSDL